MNNDQNKEQQIEKLQEELWYAERKEKDQTQKLQDYRTERLRSGKDFTGLDPEEEDHLHKLSDLHGEVLGIRNSLNLLTDPHSWIYFRLRHHEIYISKLGLLDYRIKPTGNGWIVWTIDEQVEKEITSLDEAIEVAKEAVRHMELYRWEKASIMDDLKKHGIDDPLLVKDIMDRFELFFENQAIHRIKGAWKANLQHHGKIKP